MPELAAVVELVSVWLASAPVAAKVLAGAVGVALLVRVQHALRHERRRERTSRGFGDGVWSGHV